MASEWALQFGARRFEAQGLESLLGFEGAKHSDLPPAVRGLIGDVKAEYLPSPSTSS